MVAEVWDDKLTVLSHGLHVLHKVPLDNSLIVRQVLSKHIHLVLGLQKRLHLFLQLGQRAGQAHVIVALDVDGEVEEKPKLVVGICKSAFKDDYGSWFDEDGVVLAGLRLLVETGPLNRPSFLQVLHVPDQQVEVHYFCGRSEEVQFAYENSLVDGLGPLRVVLAPLLELF